MSNHGGKVLPFLGRVEGGDEPANAEKRHSWHGYLDTEEQLRVQEHLQTANMGLGRRGAGVQTPPSNTAFPLSKAQHRFMFRNMICFCITSATDGSITMGWGNLSTFPAEGLVVDFA